MPSPLTVIISGCHSGPNPSPGLGIATSLREAFPDVRLISRDFSVAATGLHSDCFDESWVCAPWEGADLELQRRQLYSRLEHAWLISGLDLEVRWLADHVHPRVLAPPRRAVDASSKPAMVGATSLPVRIPDWINWSADDRELATFCRQHSWRVWVKGPAHEARAVENWQELQLAADQLTRTWGGEDLYVQRHVSGEEVSVAFAAYEGELLDAVLLEKRLVTPEGKVWGGSVGPIPESLARSLGSMLRRLRWTGGGELECIRDAAGGLWLFDWNPRFPAWIHGATLAGHNLPAALLVRATGSRPQHRGHTAAGFVRTVLEIPQRMTLLSMQSPSLDAPGDQGKHPSGMPQLRRRLSVHSAGALRAPCGPLPEELQSDLIDAARQRSPTPRRVLLGRVAAARFARAARLRQRHPRLAVAYSLKTDPSRELLALARHHGLWAETISLGEIELAIHCGWPPGQIVYNGPVPLRPRPAGGELQAAFADDAEILGAYLQDVGARVIGIRLRPPFEPSRFGVDLECPEAFGSLVRTLASAPPRQRLGISFHLASSACGLERWERCAVSIFDFAAALEQLSRRRFSLVNFGGGWTAEDFDTALEPVIARLLAEAGAKLSGQPEFLIEPGKALAEPAQAILTRVVHIPRSHRGNRAAVLDAGVADVPLFASFPHRVALVRETVARLGAGSDELLGPSCMEGDRLSTAVALPEDLMVGDLIAICDAGGYDASMAHQLGRGIAP